MCMLIWHLVFFDAAGGCATNGSERFLICGGPEWNTYMRTDIIL